MLTLNGLRLALVRSRYAAKVRSQTCALAWWGLIGFEPVKTQLDSVRVEFIELNVFPTETGQAAKYEQEIKAMKILATLLTTLALVGCSSSPNMMYRSQDRIQDSSNFELCRAALDSDARLKASNQETNFLDAQVRQRNLDEESCFNVLLAEYSSSSMCRRYQRAVVRGEPTALVGFGTTLSVQEIRRGFERNNIACDPSKYTGSTKSGLQVISQEIDKFNDSMTERRSRQKTTDCYELYDGAVRCREY